MNAITYPEILKSFGTPLLNLPTTNGPKQWKTYEIIISAVVLGLATYGACKLYTTYKEYKSPIINKDQKK